MSKIIILLLIIFPFISNEQQLKCCKSASEVQSHLSGKWKIKNSNSKTVYHYWFENGKGNLIEFEPPEKGEELIIEDNHSFVEIIEVNKGFKLRFTYLYGNWISDVKFLNSEKLILINEGKEIEYYKILE